MLTEPTTWPVHQRLPIILSANHLKGPLAAWSYRFDQISCRQGHLPPGMLCPNSPCSRLWFVARFSAVQAATYSIHSSVKARPIETFGLFTSDRQARNKK